MDLQLHVQVVSITTNAVCSNPAQLGSDLQQAGSFLRVLRFPPPIKLIATIYNCNIIDSGVEHRNHIHNRLLVRIDTTYMYVN